MPTFTRRLKILYLIDILDNIGGAEKNYCQIVTNLDHRRFVPLPAALKVLRFPEVFKAGSIEPLILDLHNVFSMTGMLWLHRLSRLIRKEKIDLLVSYFEGSDYLAMALSFLNSVPFIVNRRDMGYRYNWKQKILNRVVSKFCSRMIAVSDGVARKVCHDEGAARKKIEVIYNAIDLDSSHFKYKTTREAKQRYGLDPERIVIGILAVLRRVKRHDIFIKAASIIIESHPDAQFLIAGFDAREQGATLETLRHRIEDLELGKNFRVVTQGFNALEALTAMDVSVLTSDSEGFSNSILEAMMLGKPVVATNVGGNPEIVSNGVTGLLVAPDSPSETAAAIIKLIEDEKMRQDMGNAGAALITSQFTVTAMIEKHQALYQNVCQRVPA